MEIWGVINQQPILNFWKLVISLYNSRIFHVIMVRKINIILCGLLLANFFHNLHTIYGKNLIHESYIYSFFLLWCEIVKAVGIFLLFHICHYQWWSKVHVCKKVVCFICYNPFFKFSFTKKYYELCYEKMCNIVPKLHFCHSNIWEYVINPLCQCISIYIGDIPYMILWSWVSVINQNLKKLNFSKKISNIIIVEDVGLLQFFLPYFSTPKVCSGYSGALYFLSFISFIGLS